jgi:hypothetical protein
MPGGARIRDEDAAQIETEPGQAAGLDRGSGQDLAFSTASARFMVMSSDSSWASPVPSSVSDHRQQ